MVVGGICCRFDSVATPAATTAADAQALNEKAADAPAADAATAAAQQATSGPSQQRIYIMTLTVLAPYRGRGIGQLPAIHMHA